MGYLIDKRNDSTSKDKQICIVSKYHPNFNGGLEYVIRGIIKTLSNAEDKKFNVNVICMDKRKNDGKYPFAKIITFQEIPIPIIGKILYNFQAGLMCLSKNYDIIHTHGEMGFGFAMFRKLNLGKNKLFIHTFHGTSCGVLKYYQFDFPKKNAVAIIIYKMYRAAMSFLECVAGKECDIAVAVSNGVKNEIVNYYGINPKKIKVIHNGIDTNKFKLQLKYLTRTELSLDSDLTYGLFVGKEVGRKGLDIAIETFKILEKDCKNLKLLVAGHDKEKIISNYDFEFIIPLGFVPDDKFPKVYNAAAFLIFPSRYEGCPITLLEAFACGVPVIASYDSKIAEIAKNYQEAIIVDNNPEDFAKAIVELMSNEKLHEKLSKNGRRLAERLSEEKQYGQYLELYN